MRHSENKMKQLDKLVSLEEAQGVSILTSEELDELLKELTDMVQELEKLAVGRTNC